MMDAADAATLPNAADVPETDGAATEEEMIRTDAAESADGMTATDAAESADATTRTDAAESTDGMIRTDTAENAARAADAEANLPARFRRHPQDHHGRPLKTADATKYFGNAGDAGFVPGLFRFKYTFTEQCEEIPGLKLEDGTTKIFLNMTSKNGSQELVSMLQYMKETRIDNPEILVRDPRILELDQIVSEVKESEEWEAVQMNLLEFGIERGKEIGMSQGKAAGEQLKLLSQIRKKMNKGCRIHEIADALEESEETILHITKLMQQEPDASDEELLKKLT